MNKRIIDKKDNERGSVTVIVIVLLMVAVVFGVGSARLAYSTWDLTNEQLFETELRLVAESGIEAAVRDISLIDLDNPTLNFRRLGRQPMPSVIMPYNYIGKIDLKVHYEVIGDKLQLTAVAAYPDTSAASGIKREWQRAKRVRALMQRKGNKYVWLRWLT